MRHVAVEQVGGLTIRRVGAPESGRPTVVLMHGFGAPGTDLVALAGEIPAPEGTCFVFPEAPLQLPRQLGGGRAWWMIDLEELDRAMRTGRPRDLSGEPPPGLATAREAVEQLLRALEAEHGMCRDQLVLGGFSQGAMLACDVALRSEEPLGGLALMSATYLAEREWAPRMARRAGLPVLMSHGRRDALLPFFAAERLRDALVEAGLDVTWIPFDEGHTIVPAVVRALGALIARGEGR